MTQVDFYDKEQSDALLGAKANAADVYDKTAIDAKNIGSTDDLPVENGSLWSRVKYLLAHWMTTDTEQTVSAKKTFSISPEVPATPANDNSAVSQTWAENVAYENDTINNLLHKEGYEAIIGSKKTILNAIPAINTDTNDHFQTLHIIVDASNNAICEIGVARLSNQAIQFYINVKNTDNSWKYGALVVQGDQI